MIRLVEDSVGASVAALQGGDRGSAEAVLQGDDRIDELENVLSEHCHQILALHQPMATSLRKVIATLHVNSELERIGDLARSVAERSEVLSNSSEMQVPLLLRELTHCVLAMMQSATEAFLNEDVFLARRVRESDSHVDEIHSMIIHDLIDQMKGRPTVVDAALSLFSAVRNLERIADHATNIAEETVFLVEGEMLRHKHAWDPNRTNYSSNGKSHAITA